MSNTKCLNPNCRRPAHVRGLCAVCYVRANEVIKKGLSTWEKLEAAHKILPSKRQKIFTRKWLLDKVG